MRNPGFIWLVFGLLFVCQSAMAQTTFDVHKMNQLFDVLESNNRMMGSVTLAKNGKVIYQRMLGYRTISDQEKSKIDAETEFRIGSVTKVFTAVMIHQLVEEKKLTLETRLSKFFPNIPNADKITVAHLLSHTSGLADYSQGVSYDPADPEAWIFHPQTSRQMMTRIAKLKPNFEPGEENQYSNTNYTLLGYIIEAVTKSTFGEQLDTRIVKKIGLHRTRYSGKIDTTQNEACSYVYEDGKWNKNPEEELSVAGGAGGIVSTTRDMAEFMFALSEYKLIRQSSLQKMTSLFSDKFPDSCHGIASFNLSKVNKKAISKQGGIDAFTSNVIYVPEDKFAFALTINGNNYPMPKIFRTVLDIYYNHPVSLPSFKAMMLPPETLSSFEGDYSLKGAAIKISIKRNGTGLSGQATGQDTFSLQAIHETTFSHDLSGIIIEFRKDSDGKIQDFTLYQGRNVSVWEKEK